MRRLLLVSMMQDNDTGASSQNGARDRFDVLKYLGEGEQHWATLLSAGDFENAARTAEACVNTLEGFPEEFWSQLDPQSAEFMRREISFFQILRDHAAGISSNRARDFDGSTKIFENVVTVTGEASDEPISDEDPRPNQFRYFGNFAKSRLPLMAASKALLNHDAAATVASLSEAENRVAQIAPEIFDRSAELDLDGAATDRHELSLLQKIDIYSSFVIDSSMIYTAAATVGANLDAAAEFFERHETTVANLQTRITDSKLARQLSVMWQPLTGFFNASRHQIKARIALKTGDFDEALAGLETARRSFDDLSGAIPRKLPSAELLRNVSHSMASSALPQMIERVAQEKALNDEIERLTKENQRLDAELSAAKNKREAVMAEFIRSFTASDIRIETEADLRQLIELGGDLPDRVLDAMLRALDDFGDQVGESELSAAKDAISVAKAEVDVTQKIAKTQDAVALFDTMTGALSENKNTGRVLSIFLRSLFANK